MWLLTIFHDLNFETPSTWRARFLYLCPPQEHDGSVIPPGIGYYFLAFWLISKCSIMGEIEVILWPTVSRPASLGVGPFFGAHDQIFPLLLLIWKFRSKVVHAIWWGDMFVICIAVNLWFVSLKTHKIIMSHSFKAGPVIPTDTGFAVCRLLWLTGTKVELFSPLPPFLLDVWFQFPDSYTHSYTVGVSPLSVCPWVCLTYKLLHI
jgi:hypothetical protein